MEVRYSRLKVLAVKIKRSVDKKTEDLVDVAAITVDDSLQSV